MVLGIWKWDHSWIDKQALFLKKKKKKGMQKLIFGLYVVCLSQKGKGVSKFRELFNVS